MKLLLVLFLIIFEACYKGLRIGDHYLASEIVKFVYLAGAALMVFAWMELRQKISFFDRAGSFLKVLIGYVLLRFALFDIIWNISAGQDLFFYGTTKLYDRVMTALGIWGWFIKFCSFVVGIAFLTKMGNNDKTNIKIYLHG